MEYYSSSLSNEDTTCLGEMEMDEVIQVRFSLCNMFLAQQDASTEEYPSKENEKPQTTNLTRLYIWKTHIKMKMFLDINTGFMIIFTYMLSFGTRECYVRFAKLL